MFNKRILMAVAAVGIVAIVAVIFALSGQEKTLEATTGELSFSPATGEHSAGTVFSVDIMANSTGNLIAGADIIIKYDPEILEAVEQDEKFALPKEGFFAAFPPDGQNPGVLRFSVLTNTPEILNGKIATVYFSGKKAGQAKLEFLYEEGKVTDSNLAASGEARDILDEVKPAIYQIK